MQITAVSDTELVAACRAGEERSWEELVERYSRYVYAICVSVYGLPEADAEDVFQDVFTRAYERLDTVREASAVRPWLAQLTRRLCVDSLRGAARELPTEESLETGSADDAMTRIDEALDVREALAQLSPECREVLDRFFTRDQSYRMISEELSLPPGTIASRISRCLAKLRVELGDA